MDPTIELLDAQDGSLPAALEVGETLPEHSNAFSDDHTRTEEESSEEETIPAADSVLHAAAMKDAPVFCEASSNIPSVPYQAKMFPETVCMGPSRMVKFDIGTDKGLEEYNAFMQDNFPDPEDPRIHIEGEMEHKHEDKFLLIVRYKKLIFKKVTN